MTPRPTDRLNRAQALGRLGTGLLVLGFAGQARAATVVQTFANPFTVTSFTTSSSATTINLPNSSYTVQPFNTALGVLNSVTIAWNFASSFSGTTGPTVGGNASDTFGGNIAVSTIIYNGQGGGGSGGAATPSTFFSFSSAPSSETSTFTATSTGVNPAIWPLLTSGSSYTANYYQNPTSSGSFSYTNIATGSFIYTPTATVTYDYTPATVPGPLPLLGPMGALAASRRLRARCRAGKRPPFADELVPLSTGGRLQLGQPLSRGGGKHQVF